MYPRFFPGPMFAWIFLATLMLILCLCAYVDWRRMVIPKWLTIPMLVVGAVFTVVRGAWLGALGEGFWLLPGSGMLLGALDGFLFAFVGFLAGFLMIFLMWILGTCGGGDVKLFAALGAWLGPILPVFVLAGSLAVLFCQVVFKLVALGFSGKNFKKLAAANRAKEDGSPQAGKWRITYSFPVAVATLAVLLWVFRVELLLAPPRPSPNGTSQAHAR